jgi:hypothetical protein
MKGNRDENIELKKTTILDLLEGLREKILKGTEDRNNFITITQLDKLCRETRNKIDVEFLNFIEEVLSEIDESGLIKEKKTIIDNTKSSLGPTDDTTEKS